MGAGQQRAATVISSETNGRSTKPFSFLKTPKLSFVNRQPIFSRWMSPGFRPVGYAGPAGTVGEGDHMGIRRSLHRGHTSTHRWRAHSGQAYVGPLDTGAVVRSRTSRSACGS